MNTNHKPVGWFKTYLQKVGRAKSFYKNTPGKPLGCSASPNMEMSIAPPLLGMIKRQIVASIGNSRGWDPIAHKQEKPSMKILPATRSHPLCRLFAFLLLWFYSGTVSSFATGQLSVYKFGTAAPTVATTDATVSNLASSGWNFASNFNGSAIQTANTPSGNPNGTFDGNSTTKTLSFIFTPNSQRLFDLSTLSFWGGDGAFNNTNIALSYKIGTGAIVNAGSVTLNNLSAPGGIAVLRSFNLSAINALQSVSAPVTFTLTATNSGARVIWKLDDLAVDGSVQATSGDRNIPMNIVYPTKAFTENGGPVINLKNAPYNATGDGVTDDTAAFVAVMDYIYTEIAAGRNPKKTIYLPTGTYLVSDTIIYSASKATLNSFCRVRWVGQNRQNTTIKLKNNSAGFGSVTTPKAVLAWARAGYTQQGNIMWSNLLRNLTVDTGSGNPGAIGVVFMGANGCSMDNVTVRSGDGQGYAGFGFVTGVWSIQGHFSDLTVQGFAHGIRCDHVPETQPTFEYLTLTGQTVAGIQVSRAAANFRKVNSTNTVPGLVVNGDGAQVVVLDSNFGGGAAGNAALTVTDTTKHQLFARNVTASGYGTTISVNGSAVATGNIGEYMTGAVYQFDPNIRPQSLNLPVSEMPLVPWESNVANWTTPEDYTGTDAQKIQAALNSGKPAILFPKTYSVTTGSAFTVPATVKQMDFMHQESTINIGFNVNAASSEPLFIEHSNNKMPITISQPRTLVARYCGMRYSVTTTSPVVAHISNAATLAGGNLSSFCPPNSTIYARSINEEQRTSTNFIVSGGTMWVLGWKTEADRIAFEVKNSGSLEVLGGYQNFAATTDTGNPVLLNNESHASYIGTNFMSRNYVQAVWEILGGVTYKSIWSDFPARNTGNGRNYFVPMYVGYDDPGFVQNPVINGGFETPILAAATHQYIPTGGTWTFTGNAGIQRNRSAFAALPAPQSFQTAFLQGNTTASGSMSQAVSLNAGTYVIRFKAARRNTQIQPVQIKVNGVAIGGTHTPAGNQFSAFTSASFTIASTGLYTIRFETTTTSGDNTTFVDAVTVSNP